MPLEQEIQFFIVTTTEGMQKCSSSGYYDCFKYVSDAHADANEYTPTREIQPVKIASMEIEVEIGGMLLRFKCEDSESLTEAFESQAWG